MSNWYDNFSKYGWDQFKSEFDPTLGLYSIDKNGQLGEPWKSVQRGYNKGRYKAIPFGEPGPGGEYWNRANEIEEQNPYYKEYTNYITNNFGTPDVNKFLELHSNLMPKGFGFNNNTLVTGKNIHGLDLGQGTNYNPLQWWERIRNDKVIGPAHNVGMKSGKRYFYINSNGEEVPVNPYEAQKYETKEVRTIQDGNTRWTDYQVFNPVQPIKLKFNYPTVDDLLLKTAQKTGLIDSPIPEVVQKTGTIDVNGLNQSVDQKIVKTEGTSEVPTNGGNRWNIDWKKVGEGFQKIFTNPDLYAFGRYVGNLINNERVYDEELKGIRPVLKQTYNTYRQVVGDEATKQAYYRRALQGENKAGKTITSDLDKQLAYQMEAKRVGDELRAQGDLADNQEIRRTSDESNQHQWANTQRATEVANANLASMNQANALKHNLLAQKHSAQWSSTDNFLQGIEYRKRQQLAEYQQLLDKQWLLQNEYDLETDPRIAEATDKYNKALEESKKDNNGNYNYNSKAVKNAITELKNARLKVQLEFLDKYKQYKLNRNAISFTKSGGKITRKKKDDLLYKSTKDVVEHFRKMSKLSSDALNRKQIKIEKLTSHPKTKKYQQGGVAPFTVYKPVALGGESTSSSETTSSTKSSKNGDDLDLMKELFKSLSVEGLPSDVTGIYNAMQNLMMRQKAFGNDLSTSDIASMYIQQMQQINNIKFNKAQFDIVQKIVNEKDAGSEFAIDKYGRIAVQNLENHKIEYVKLSELKDNSDKYNPLRNQDLLTLREYSPDQAFQHELLEVAGNATSMSEIAKFLKEYLPKIESSETVIEGYTRKDSNNIKEGIRQLLADAPDGSYKLTRTNKSNSQQSEMALEYLYNVLPNNMKTLLEINSGGKGKQLIAQMISSGIEEINKTELTAVTGKAAGDGSSNSGGNAETSAGLAFVLGQGPRELIDFNTGSSVSGRALGIKGVLQTHSKENLGQGATLQDATKSQQGGYLEWSKATFGGSRLNSQAYSHIILNDSTIMGVDLPYTKDINGNEVPDFQMLKKLEEADFKIYSDNITDPEKINLIYQQYGLPPKYDKDGKLNELNYKRYAAIQVTLDEQSLQDKDSILSDEVQLAGDIERDLYVEAMKKEDKNKDYDLSNGMWITGWGRDELYKGTVFVPYSEDIAFAALSSGEGFKQNLPDNAAEIQKRQYASKASTYKTPDVTLSQIK